jgi:PAS domain S-box-containing protein
VKQTRIPSAAPRSPWLRLSDTELKIFGPATIALLVLLLLALFLAQRNLTHVARDWDLDRVERYIRLCRDKLEAESRTGPEEQSLRELEEIGLFIDVFPPDTEIPSSNPRYVPSLQSVEAWDVVRGPDGQPVSVIRIGRYDSTTRLAMAAVRYAALAGGVGGLLLIFTIWLALRRTMIRGIHRLSKEVSSGIPDSPPLDPAADPLEALRSSVVRAVSTRESEAAVHRRLLDEHNEAACVGTTDGVLLEVNSAYARLFGRSREELIGSNYFDLIPPSDRTEVVDALQKLSARHPTNMMTHRVVLPDGSIRWVRWRDRAVFDDQGAVKEILSFGLDVTTEQTLRDQTERLRLAFDQMQSLARTGSLTWNLAGDRMEWTDETFRLLGLAREQTAPTLDRLLETVLPEDREPLRHLFQRARENGDPFEREFRALLPDGSVRVLQSRAEVVADPKTKLLDQLTCTLRDITALRDAESATKRELRFREAIEQSLAAGIVVSDDKGRNLLVNPAFCTMTGWSAEELVGATAPYPYWPEEEIPEIAKAFELAISGQTPARGFELKFRRKDGSRFDVLIKVAPLLDSNDVQLGWLGAVTDISAIQQTRRELQTTNERLRIAQDVAEFGVWDWNPMRDTLHWDSQSFALFGYPDATDPREVWTKVLNEEEQERLTYELKRLIATGGTSGQDRIRARWPDGTVHDILSTYVILRDETGRGTRVLGINRDITSELEEERELRLANERLAAALEGGQFGTFEHVIGLGDINWSPANYEINGIDPSVTDPAGLFACWRSNIGDFFPQLMARISALHVGENHLTYEFTAHPPGREPRRVRSSAYIERNKQGHPVRLVGITRRID